ncbi:MAG: hypothetical protein RMX68_017910 [Aulosira sp. ZfuVER01]|nr:hypothetical protein [Aulosira sp. ZfuVER01]MDZ7999124.1 hypothetical protein [Aulosira sp. DedVER01a]MDZ8051152.1 hypothetical protein [Aulosira sp. ZfuCHP01]
MSHDKPFGFSSCFKSGNPTPLATLRERFQRTSRETRPTQWLPNALLTLLRRYRCANTTARLRKSISIINLTFTNVLYLASCILSQALGLLGSQELMILASIASKCK